MKRTNEEWLTSLHSFGPQREEALNDLHKIITAALPYALSKWISQNDPRFTPLAEEVAQETILKVSSHLGTFEGRSQFTTWVHTIAVRVALTELRRAKWKEVSLEEMIAGKEMDDEPQEIADQSPSTEVSIEKKEIMAMIHKMMMEDLTEKQRTALIAVALRGAPLEEVARRMGTERNTLYKLLHDARLKLKKSLAKQGLSPAEILTTFEETR
jgi:RNA polymerase sigma-70 factor, ECF subfamily